jgi:hypothetical protein
LIAADGEIFMASRRFPGALAGAASVLLATAGAAFFPATHAAATVQLGGFRAISTDDANVQGAGAFLAEQVGGELASVDSAQYQSTANTNYRITITLESGARWSGQITKDRESGDYSMMGSPSQLQAASGGEDEVDTGSNQAPDDE